MIKLLLKKTYSAWSGHNAPLLAAGLSYFSIFSLAPFLILLVAVAGMVLGDAVAESEVLGQARRVLGPSGAEFLKSLLDNAQRSGKGVASAFSILMLLVGASGLFKQLQTALNVIWEAEPARRGWRQVVKNRLLLLTLLIFVGLLLLLFFTVNVGLGAFADLLGEGSLLGNAVFWKTVNFAASFAVLTSFLALVFKLLPRTHIGWKDVLVGSAATALMQSIGILLIGLYFSHVEFNSLYGVAGSVVAVLVWIYFSAQILLFGAELTWVYSNIYGSRAGRRP